MGCGFFSFVYFVFFALDFFGVWVQWLCCQGGVLEIKIQMVLLVYLMSVFLATVVPTQPEPF